MDQELFDGIAQGHLPLLAITLLGARDPLDHRAAIDAPSSRNTGIDPLLAQAQWIALLAHLSQTARRCTQPTITDQLKAVGIRRSTTIVTSLAREYVRAWDLAISTGFVSSADAVLRVTDTLPSHGPLTDDFRALADTYRLLLWVMAPRDGGQLSRWLSERASVHAAQAQAVQ